MTNDQTPQRDRLGGPQMTAGEAVTAKTIAAPGDIQRARVRWRLAQQRQRRRVSHALDQLLVEPRKLRKFPQYDGGDHWRDCGMHLGVAERERAA